MLENKIIEKKITIDKEKAYLIQIGETGGCGHAPVSEYVDDLYLQEKKGEGEFLSYYCGWRKIFQHEKKTSHEGGDDYTKEFITRYGYITDLNDNPVDPESFFSGESNREFFDPISLGVEKIISSPIYHIKENKLLISWEKGGCNYVNFYMKQLFIVNDIEGKEKKFYKFLDWDKFNRGDNYWKNNFYTELCIEVEKKFLEIRDLIAPNYNGSTIICKDTPKNRGIFKKALKELQAL